MTTHVWKHAACKARTSAVGKPVGAAEVDHAVAVAEQRLGKSKNRVNFTAHRQASKLPVPMVSYHIVINRWMACAPTGFPASTTQPVDLTADEVEILRKPSHLRAAHAW